MRASRLISILTILQAQGCRTARQLAEQCEVSMRTIYRDIDALAAAGVPVYSDRGSCGGYRLLDSYRTRLNGLSQQEAEALFLSGVTGAAAALGLDTALAAAQLKLLAALPLDLRHEAGAARSRFLVDAPPWFAEPEQPAHLRIVAEAVRRQHELRIRYRSWNGVITRRVAPLGLVLKAGAWYLAAGTGTDIRTYRIVRILEVESLDARFERPSEFDLEAFWHASRNRFERDVFGAEATVRISPLGMQRLAQLGPAFVQAAEETAAPPDEDGWRMARLPIESPRHASVDLLRLGAEIEVLLPLDLREMLAATARSMHRIYRDC
jgi:predicted DNA-binding transcriptional regulator YafY